MILHPYKNVILKVNAEVKKGVALMWDIFLFCEHG
jgi:hypothetical protein